MHRMVPEPRCMSGLSIVLVLAVQHRWLCSAAERAEAAAEAHRHDCFPGAAGGVFDPFGFSRGDTDLLRKYKENEIKNGRLAMVPVRLPACCVLACDETISTL